MQHVLKIVLKADIITKPRITVRLIRVRHSVLRGQLINCDYTS